MANLLNDSVEDYIQGLLQKELKPAAQRRCPESNRHRSHDRSTLKSRGSEGRSQADHSENRSRKKEVSS